MAKVDICSGFPSIIVQLKGKSEWKRQGADARHVTFLTKQRPSCVSATGLCSLACPLFSVSFRTLLKGSSSYHRSSSTSAKALTNFLLSKHPLAHGKRRGWGGKKRAPKADKVRMAMRKELFCWCFVIFRVASDEKGRGRSDGQKAMEIKSWKNVCQLSNYFSVIKGSTEMFFPHFLAAPTPWRIMVTNAEGQRAGEWGKSVVLLLIRCSLHGELMMVFSHVCDCTISWKIGEEKGIFDAPVGTPDVT